MEEMFYIEWGIKQDVLSSVKEGTRCLKYGDKKFEMVWVTVLGWNKMFLFKYCGGGNKLF